MGRKILAQNIELHIDKKLYSIETAFLFNRDSEVLFHFTKRGDFVHKTNLTLPLFLEVICQARKVSSHVFVCYEFQFCLFLQFFYWILELFKLPMYEGGSP